MLPTGKPRLDSRGFNNIQCSYSVATISFHKKFEKYLKNQEIATKVVRYFIAMTRATE